MRLPHVVPFAKAPIYFFTACTANRQCILANDAAFGILRDIWERSAEKNGWFVGRFLAMPDHVHFFACPSAVAIERAAWCKTWKSLSSRAISRSLNIPPPIWQSDTFDHILRSSESYSEKWDYVTNNPVRAKLASRATDRSWQGEIHSIAF